MRNGCKCGTKYRTLMKIFIEKNSYVKFDLERVDFCLMPWKYKLWLLWSDKTFYVN